MDAIKIALLVDSQEKFPGFDELFLRVARKSSFVTLSHVIVLSTPTNATVNSQSKLALRILTSVVRSVESLLLRRFNRLDPRFKTTSHRNDQSAEEVGLIQIELDPRRPYLQDVDIASLGSHGFDYIVATSNKLPIDQFLSVSNLGVIFIDARSDGTEGFKEVLNQVESTDFRIVRIQDVKGKSILLREGRIATSLLYLQNEFRVRSKAIFLLVRVLEDPTRWPASRNKVSDLLSTRDLDHEISLTDVTRYVYQSAKALQSKLRNRIFSRVQRWGVLVGVPGSIRNPSLEKLSPIPNPRHRYLADPFVIQRDSRHIIFVEDFDLRSQRGSISAFEFVSGKVEALGEVLREEFHLSFPFVFESGADLYMVPESSQNSDVRLYKAADRIGLKWNFVTTLISDVQAADSIVFRKNDKFWLLTNIDSSHLGEFESELHLFWSDELETSSWNPLPVNPIFVDSTRGRNGGLVKNPDGRLFRVFQKQGFDSYGVGVGIAEILEISVSEYIERQVDYSFPKIPGKLGPHTLSTVGPTMAIDYWEIASSK